MSYSYMMERDFDHTDKGEYTEDNQCFNCSNEAIGEYYYYGGYVPMCEECRDDDDDDFFY